MAVQVETLEKLERRITLTLPAEIIQGEVHSRLKKLSRTVKADGFRPGKVPMSVVAQRYGWSVQLEVVNDKVGRAFNDAASEARLRVAGRPRITAREQAPEGQFAFDATFEVFPEVVIGDLSAVEVERVSTEVTEAAIDRTIEILRKQRRSFSLRPAAEGAQAGDRVTIDFEGKIDGEPFEGGKADAFQFVIGEGQMLEQFDQSVRGMKVGESKTFPLEDRGAAPARSRRRLREVARHQGRHGGRPACRRQEEPRARGEVPRAGPQQGGRDGRADEGGRARPAEGARRGRGGAPARRCARRPQAARREGRRQGRDPGRDLQAAGRTTGASGARGGRSRARQQPAGPARAAAGAYRRDEPELREARRGEALGSG